MASSPGFGSICINSFLIKEDALLTLGFPMPPPQKGLDKLMQMTRWLVLQKARRHPLQGSDSL